MGAAAYPWVVGVVSLLGIAGGVSFVPYSPAFSAIALPALVVLHSVSWMVGRGPIFLRVATSLLVLAGYMVHLYDLAGLRYLATPYLLVFLYLSLINGVAFVYRVEPEVRRVAAVQHLAVLFILVMAYLLERSAIQLPATGWHFEASGPRFLFVPPLAVLGIVAVAYYTGWRLMYTALVAAVIGQIGNGLIDLSQKVGPEGIFVVGAFACWALFLVGIIYSAFVYRRSQARQPTIGAKVESHSDASS